MLYKFKDQVTNLQIHLYIKPVTNYIINNYQKLLSNWQQPPKKLIIFLFQSQLELREDNHLTQQEKERLKSKFMELAKVFKNLFDHNNDQLEIICPQTGLPINCNSSQTNFDLVAVINQSLGINFQETEDHCKVLNYQDWKTAIYPCLILSQNDLLIDEKKLNLDWAKVNQLIKI